MSFDKIQEPQRRHEQGKMCWCGNPDCPGDKMSPSRSSSSALDDMVLASRFFSRSPFEGISDRGRLDQALRESIMADFLRPAAQPAKPSVPATYTEAREAVKDYLLDVDHDTAWDDVVGNDAARQALIEAIEEPKLHPELYEHYGMKPPKGVMLYGPPGCGKTMFAKASAAAVGRVYGAKAEVLVINGPSIQSPYIGKTEETIRAIFKFAREYHALHKHPLTVFFDEAEVLFPDRTGRTRRVSPYEESNVAQFLSEMDGMNSVGAFVILATNRPEAIDEALLRDGRCDRKIKVERPTKQAVEAIVRKSLAAAPLSVELDDLVMAATESFFNPHYVIQEGQFISAMIEKDGAAKLKNKAVNFCLEHIVSGAMVAGVARRAKSRAFSRDRESGMRGGIQVTDVLESVKEIFEENKGLEHGFAVREFISGLRLEMAEPNGRPH